MKSKNKIGFVRCPKCRAVVMFVNKLSAEKPDLRVHKCAHCKTELQILIDPATGRPFADKIKRH